MPPHLINQVVSQLGGLSKPLNRIKRSVLDQQIQRTSHFTKAYRYNSRQEFLDEYQDYLDFWFYGPVPELFTEPNTSENHESVLRDLLAQSPIYLLPFGLGQWANSTLLAQKVAMDQARFTFQDQTKQKELYDLLVWYLEEQQHDVSLRVQSAEIINTTGSWKQPAEKIKVILKLLLAEESLRQTAMQLLKPQITTLQSVDKDAGILLDSLNSFEKYTYVTQDNLPSKTLTDLAQLQSQAQQQIKYIATITDQGMRSTQILAQRYSRDGSQTRQFLQQQNNQWINKIDAWLQQVQAQINQTTQKQKIVRSNHQLLQSILKDFKQCDWHSYSLLKQKDFLTSPDDESYQSCQELYNNFLKLKKEVLDAAKSLYGKTSDEINLSISWIKFILISGFVILFLAVISPSLYTMVQPSSPRWIQDFFQSMGLQTPSNLSSTNSSQSESAVAQRFANGSLPQCGDTNSPNNCWYRVFLPNQGSNLEKVKSQYCQDAILSEDTLEIQVASFAQLQDAQNFADYMSSQYGSARVDEQICN